MKQKIKAILSIRITFYILAIIAFISLGITAIYAIRVLIDINNFSPSFLISGIILSLSVLLMAKSDDLYEETNASNTKSKNTDNGSDNTNQF